MSHTGKIGQRTISAATPVIVLFADGQVLEFTNADEAKGFINFYERNQTARSRNPGSIYYFEAGTWRHDGAPGESAKPGQQPPNQG